MNVLTNLRQTARKLGLNKIYSPIKNYVLGGGGRQIHRTALARSAMREAAAQLKPMPTSTQRSSGAVGLHYLTGKDHWYQTAFSLHSFLLNCRQALPVTFHDDGTLQPNQTALLRQLFPGCLVESEDEAMARIETVLPERNYPTLRECQQKFPLSKKLVNLFAGNPGWKLVLDSDMLFFRRPDFLLNWMTAPQHPCYMIDHVDSYGYSETLRRSLQPLNPPPRMNLGVWGWTGDGIDWDKLEFWATQLLKIEGSQYNLIQGLFSMYYAGQPLEAAPQRDYRLCTQYWTAAPSTAVMHHFVLYSRLYYFERGWRLIKKRSEAFDGIPA